MKTELMKELFDKAFPQLENGVKDVTFKGFQAACNMLLQHIEVLPDDAPFREGDLFRDCDGNLAYIDHKGQFEDVNDYSGFHYPSAKRILTNGKFCIKESDLIKGGEA